MFPEIAREDVFRLETRRLWLRWPFASDVTAKGDADRATQAARIEALRQDNAGGCALHLVLTGRGSDRRPFGTVSLSPVRERIENCGLLLRVSLEEDRRGAGYMTEAVQAVVDAAFMLTETPLIGASSRVLDPGFRRVLEKCGFAFCGTGLDTAAGDGGLAASDRFRLDRKAWTSLKTWRVPEVVRDRVPSEASLPCPCPA